MLAAGAYPWRRKRATLVTLLRKNGVTFLLASEGERHRFDEEGWRVVGKCHEVGSQKSKSGC